MGQRAMSEHQKNMCNGIIHTASVAAGAAGAGLAQIPLSDTALITPIQIGMVISLSQVFDVRIGEGAAKSLVAGFAASHVGRAAAQILVGWIPGIGNTINSVTAAALTEAIGWKASDHFFSIYCDELKKIANAFDKAADAFKKRFDDLEKEAKGLARKFEEWENQIEEDSELINKLTKALIDLSNKYDELKQNVTDAMELKRMDTECGQPIEMMKNKLRVIKST